ncbi:type IV secretion system protein [Bradyrhizobium ivorense]|uniref:type IV secretion system protein n=1 Tax=Bradyrhizobium ivorense TaxID=2511166 RepID=UPI001E5DED86|nr:type IV secretion system protein [Bradyrhizobium ivorense]
MAARREWNERYGSYIKRESSWRMAALGSIAVAVIAVSGLVWVSGQAKVVPYAVQLNGNNEVVRVQRADVMARPNANEMRAALRKWVIGARTVYVDLRAEQAMVDETYAMTLPDSPAYQNLANYHRDSNPYTRAANETVEVEVKAVVPVSDETWQVEWTETTKQRSGKIVDTKQWQGTFTVLISPPTNEAQIMVNPLGVYVRQFAWTARL